MRIETWTERGRRIKPGRGGQTKTARGGFLERSSAGNVLVSARNALDSLRREREIMSEVSAQNGDVISVHYVGKFPGGKVFDTSMKSEAIKAGLFNPARDYKPLQVILGRHQVISGFEEALVGMKVNETKDVVLPPEKAYGKTGRHPMSGKTLQFRLLVTNIKKP